MFKQSFIKLTSIQIGLLINLPMLTFGFSLSKLYGPFNAFIGTFLAGIILFLLSYTAYPLIEKYPNNNTLEIINNFFNEIGQKIAQLAFLIPMTGWFCIQLLIAAQSIEATGLNKNLLFILIGLTTIFIVLKGINGISKFSDLCFFPMIITILYAIYTIFDNTMILNEYNHSILSIPFIFKSSIISLSSLICLVIDNPIFYQHSKSKKDSLISFFLLHIIFFPLVLSIGIIYSFFSNSDNLISFFFGISKSSFYFYWIIIFFSIIAITTNIGNLISAGFAFEKLFKISFKKSIFIIGIIGIILTMYNFFDNMINALDIINTFVAAVFGVLLVRIYNKNSPSIKQKKQNTAILIISSIFGILSFFNILTITEFYFINTLLFSIIITAIFSLISDE